MAKYFATSLALEKAVSEPRARSNCSAISTTSTELGPVGIEVDHVPRLLGRRRTGVDGHADVGLSQRWRALLPFRSWRLVPRALLRLDQVHLRFRGGFGQEVVDACLLAIAAAVSGLSPVIITVRIPIWRIWSNLSRIPCFTTSFNSMTPRMSFPSLPLKACRPNARRSRRWGQVARVGPALFLDPASHRVGRTLRICWPSRSRPDIGVVAEKGTKVGWAQLRSWIPKRSFASTTIERPSGVWSAREASWAVAASSCRCGHRRGGKRWPGGCPG